MENSDFVYSAAWFHKANQGIECPPIKLNSLPNPATDLIPRFGTRESFPFCPVWIFIAHTHLMDWACNMYCKGLFIIHLLSLLSDSGIFGRKHSVQRMQTLISLLALTVLHQYHHGSCKTGCARATRTAWCIDTITWHQIHRVRLNETVEQIICYSYVPTHIYATQRHMPWNDVLPFFNCLWHLLGVWINARLNSMTSTLNQQSSLENTNSCFSWVWGCSLCLADCALFAIGMPHPDCFRCMLTNHAYSITDAHIGTQSKHLGDETLILAVMRNNCTAEKKPL